MVLTPQSEGLQVASLVAAASMVVILERWTGWLHGVRERVYIRIPQPDFCRHIVQATLQATASDS